MDDEYGFEKCVNIINTGDEIEGPKRQRIPALAEWECQVCEEVNVIDYSKDYMSYPTYNKVFIEYVACKECGAEESFYAVLRVNIELVPDIEGS